MLAAVATDSMAASGEIPLTRDGGVYQVLATINGWLVRPFVVDSGAADVQVSAVPTERQRAGRRAGVNETRSTLGEPFPRNFLPRQRRVTARRQGHEHTIRIPTPGLRCDGMFRRGLDVLGGQRGETEAG